MPVRHEIDACAGRIRVDVSGDVTAAEILGVYAAIAADPARRPDLGVLADCRCVRSVPTFSELGALASATPRAAPGVRPVRAAVVVSSPWLFGIARQFAALAEPSGVRVIPFYDGDEATEWLTSSADSAVVARDR